MYSEDHLIVASLEELSLVAASMSSKSTSLIFGQSRKRPQLKRNIATQQFFPLTETFKFVSEEKKISSNNERNEANNYHQTLSVASVEIVSIIWTTKNNAVN